MNNRTKQKCTNIFNNCMLEYNDYKKCMSVLSKYIEKLKQNCKKTFYKPGMPIIDRDFFEGDLCMDSQEAFKEKYDLFNMRRKI